MIMREFDCAIEDSGLKLCADLIQMIYAGQGWQINKRTIRFRGNGSVIRFRGLSDTTESSIRSVEGVDIFWFEEGQYMSTKSFETLPADRARRRRAMDHVQPALPIRSGVPDVPDEH